MAEGISPAPQPPPACPPPTQSDVLPAPPEQLLAPPVQVQDPVQPSQVQVQPGQPPLNRSYFKPQFSGKQEEDAEAHLLRTSDWMETHNFPDRAKVQRFCLTFTGEARLWYKSLKPIVVDQQGLKDQFRQQYLKFGTTQEQLFHVKRSFHYDENVETIDAYVNRIKQ